MLIQHSPDYRKDRFRVVHQLTYDIDGSHTDQLLDHLYCKGEEGALVLDAVDAADPNGKIVHLGERIIEGQLLLRLEMYRRSTMRANHR